MTWMKRNDKVRHGEYSFLKKCRKDIDKEIFLRVGTNNHRRYSGKRPIRYIQINRALDQEYIRIGKKDIRYWEDMLDA